MPISSREAGNKQMSCVRTQDKSPDLSTPFLFFSRVIFKPAAWLQQHPSCPKSFGGATWDWVRKGWKQNKKWEAERYLLGQLPLVWGAVALGARFTCNKGGCHRRAGERNSKHSRWKTKAGQPPTHKYRQDRPTTTLPTAGAICLKAGKGVRRWGLVPG